MHSLSNKPPVAGKPIPIHVAGEPVGVALRHSDGFKFLAVKFAVFSIDGALFPTIEAAERAAYAVMELQDADFAA